MKTRLYLLLPALLACIFAGCGNGDGNTDDTGEEGKAVSFRNVNIQGAKTLFIAESASTRSGFTRTETDETDPGVGVEPKLYRITASGDTYEVEFRDTDNKTIPVITDHFVNIYNKFVLMSVWYENEPNELAPDLPKRVQMLLLVNIRDGAVCNVDFNSPYSGPLLDIVSHCKAGGSLADFAMHIQVDKSGSVYLHSDGQMFKIYVSDGAINISQTPLNLGESGQWLMNPNEDIWYNYYCMTSGGEFIDSSDKLDREFCFVKESVSGNFFRFESDLGVTGEAIPPSITIHKYTPGATDLERTVDLEANTESYIYPALMPLTFVKDHIVIISNTQWWGPSTICVIDKNNVIREYANGTDSFPRADGYFSDKYTYVTGNYIYDCAADWEDRSDPGRNKIRRFNPVDGSVTTVYEAPSAYTITGYKVTKNDVMTISALEGATGNPVTITVEANGTATEHKEYNNKTIYQLERLN